jgi:hypothetical protein
MRFALVETESARQGAVREPDLESVLVTGGRLHIGADVDIAVLR